MAYDLFWRDSVNVTASYRTRQKAVSALREALDAHGRDYVAGFLLAHCDGRGNYRAIAEGEDLLALVESSPTTHRSPHGSSVIRVEGSDETTLRRAAS